MSWDLYFDKNFNSIFYDWKLLDNLLESLIDHLLGSGDGFNKWIDDKPVTVSYSLRNSSKLTWKIVKEPLITGLHLQGKIMTIQQYISSENL
jgi:hypothetical protein